MQKLLYVLAAFLLSCPLFAQVPQAICYQAVATDPSGRELAGQNIRIKLSILKGSSNGTEEWVETHAPTTDGFGLFDFKIGEGTRTGGVQTNFGNIRWGADKYFLKIEMDITGGNNFTLMGVNQLISVPYALHADRAGFADSAAVSNRATTATTAQKAIFADSANAANRSLSANYAQKAGYADSAQAASRALTAFRANSAETAQNAVSALRANMSDSAIVSSRAVNAINATNAVNAQSATKANFADSATTAHKAVNAQNAIKSIRTDSASFAWYADSSRRAGQAQKAILADSAMRAQLAWTALNANKAINADSAGKAAFAFRAANADTARVSLSASDDRDRDPTNEIQSLIYRNDSLFLTKPNAAPSVIAFSKETFRAPGASIDFPMGILGESVVLTTNYTVPRGKTLYVSAVDNNVKLADGKVLYAQPGMPIITENNTVLECYCTGILLENTAEIKPFIYDFSPLSFEYTVPVGYTMIVKSGMTERGILDLQIDTDIFKFYTTTVQTPRLVAITQGKRVRKASTLLPQDKLILTGYLIKNKE